MAAPTSKAQWRRFIAPFWLLASLFLATEALGQGNVLSLKDVPVPEPPPEVLAEYVKDKGAAIALGKALFWDVQLGSDGTVACATCHFNAGADIRSRNQLSPGLLGDNTLFGNPAVGNTGHPEFGPNYALSAADFPLHKRENPTARVPRPDFGPVSEGDILAESLGVLRDTDDVVSSQGVIFGQFLGLPTRNNAAEVGLYTEPDPLGFQVALGRRAPVNVRRVEPRQAPPVVNAVFNFEQFWDGRASVIFNGVNPFGFRDTESKLKRVDNNTSTLVDVEVRIPNASLASQAVGPVLSEMEMSLAGRSFPMVGRKLLNAKPLARQLVSPDDSVLGAFSQARNRPGRLISPGRLVPERVIGNRVIPARVVGRRAIPERVFGRPGLTTANYAEMVRAAFQPDWYSSSELITVGDEQFTQMEYNFSLFFGLALQLYQATLISDDTPFDRFQGSELNVRGGGQPIPPQPNALTPQELLGYDIFFGTNLSGNNPDNINGNCTSCHAAPEFTNASFRSANVSNGVPQDIIEPMFMADNSTAFYDAGFYNIGTRPTTEDIARGGSSPFGFPLSYVELALMRDQLPESVRRWVPNLPAQCADGLFLDEFTGLCTLPAPVNNRIAVRGAFKSPSLRNGEFSGPYLHNGADATLRQVMDFYIRGSNFPATNFNDMDPNMGGILELDPTAPGLTAEQRQAAEDRIKAVVAFLANGLTDDRVRYEKAPFDHPQLIVFDGARRNPRQEIRMRIPAVGRNGRLTPIPRFLDLDPQTP